MSLLVRDPEDAPEGDPADDVGTAPQQPDAPADEATPQATDLAGRKTESWSKADTQYAQQNAEMKRLLGLPKNASVATVQAAIDSLRQPQQATDWDNLDPVVAERLQANEEAIWDVGAQAHGDEVRDAARDLYQRALSERNPAAFMRQFVDAVLAVTEAPGADESPDEEQLDEQPEPPMPSLAEGDSSLAPRPTTSDPTGGRRDSGDMIGFVRGMFGR